MPGTDYQIGVVKDIHVVLYKRIAMNGLLCHCIHCKPINLHVLILSERSINNLKDKIPKGRSDVMLYFETTKKKLNDRIYVDYKKNIS